MLRQVGNVFADYKPVGFPFDFMCLPPGSSIHIEADAVAIETPFCRIHLLSSHCGYLTTVESPEATIVRSLRAGFERKVEKCQNTKHGQTTSWNALANGLRRKYRKEKISSEATSTRRCAKRWRRKRMPNSVVRGLLHGERVGIRLA